jgi:Na+/H+ antiporter NhaA
MAAIAKVLTYAFHDTTSDVEVVKTIAMFCGIGLTVSLMIASYGVDLSPGFF